MTITDFGIAVVENDSHLSKWVVEQRRLDVQDEYCRMFQKYIPIGGWVADVGACLGDHTLSYSRMVGEAGKVHAFDPNPDSFECLAHNMRELPNVVLHRMALGACPGFGRSSPSEVQPYNLGASRFVLDSDADELSQPLDYVAAFWPRLDFLKIDAEGSEPEIIQGAIKTIERLRPVILIEVNRPILAANGRTASDVLHPLLLLGYTVQPSEPHLSMDLPELDVLALPR